EQLVEALHRRLQCEVQALDPFTSVERDARVGDAIADRSLFAGPIGMLLARTAPRVPGLDFLAPRKPAVKRDERKRRKVMIGAGAAALVLLLGGGQWLRLGSLDSKIAALAEEEQSLDKKIADGAPTKAAADLVSQWIGEGEDWLDELPELTERMP